MENSMFGTKKAFGWLLLLLCVRGSAGGGFLIMSSPANSRVGYIFLPDSGVTAVSAGKDLITSGLSSPMGVAVDQRRPAKLLVCDPDPGVQKIYKYDLKVDGEDISLDGSQGTAVNNVAARQVAVDGLGNIFFSNEQENQIMKLSADKFLKGESAPEVIYAQSAGVSAVSGPGGVAVDNFHVFWVNKQEGNMKGTVVKADEKPSTPSNLDSVVQLENNAMKAFGVCLAMNNVYFTGDQKNVYGVKKTGGEAVTIASNLEEPRGCAWDGDGTVFIADKAANSVYSFAGTMHTLSPAALTKVATYDGVFGLAFVSRAARLPGAIVLILLAFSASWRSAT